MSKQSSLNTQNTHKNQINSQFHNLRTSTCAVVACACMIYAQHSNAAGGCGSVCIPLEALNLDKAHIPDHQYRLSIINEYAKFDNFRAGDEDITNPGGNTATIRQTTFQVDYGLSKRWTASLLLPYLKKKQQTNRFGTRTAEGFGDISVFGHYNFTPLLSDPKALTTTVGLGIKLPTGSINEPNLVSLLPPAFQAGSGAYDLIPTASFYKSLGKGSVFGGLIWRIPLEKNKRGYQFGQEIELNVGSDYPSPFLSQSLSFQLSASYLYAENDKDNNNMLPARLRQGSTVLNTGGNFMDLIPGFRWKFNSSLTLQARFSIPVYEDWNGKKETNVGQVAPDLSSQLTLIYTGL